MIRSIRLINFKCFEDSGWIDLKSINLLFGYNSSGKSSILKFFQLMKQTVTSSLEFNSTPLVFKDENGIDFGSYKDVVHLGDESRSIEISFELDTSKSQFSKNINTKILGEVFFVNLKFGFDKKNNLVVQHLFEVATVLNKQRTSMFKFTRNNIGSGWDFSTGNGLAADTPLIHQNKFILIPMIGYHSTKGYENSIPDPLSSYAILVNNIILEYFNRCHYIGPLRSHPQRIYNFAGAAPRNVGNAGESTYNLIYNSSLSENSLVPKINEWLSKYNYELECNPISNDIIQFNLVDIRNRKNKISIADAGFGISQVLPIFVELLNNQAFGKTILIEQPEIHLHSKMQAELADLLIECIKLNPLNILIIETHSENLLLRVRKKLLESKLSNSQTFNQDKLAVQYISNNGTKSIISRVNFLDNGNVETENKEFYNFFTSSFDEFMEISKLAQQLKAKQ